MMGNKENRIQTALPAGRKNLSYILKAIVVIAAAIGIVMSAAAGRRAFMGGSRVFMYFTIQSNITVLLICAAGAFLMRRGEVSDRWLAVQFMGAVSITLTGLVFCFVLAPVLGSHAWSLPNVLTHVVVPLAAVADFFISGKRCCLKRKTVFLGLLPPLAYAIYAGIGYAAGWEFSEGVRYPYFFLNWGSPAGALGFSSELPYMGCIWWILAIFILLLAVGSLYLTVLDKVGRSASGDKEKKTA